MPGPGPHMMYAMGSGLGLMRVSNGRFSAHHIFTYTINAFFGPDIGSFSEWLGSFFSDSFGSAIAEAIHHPFYYILILGFPMCILYSWLSRFLLFNGLLDSVSGVSSFFFFFFGAEFGFYSCTLSYILMIRIALVFCWLH